MKYLNDQSKNHYIQCIIMFPLIYLSQMSLQTLLISTLNLKLNFVISTKLKRALQPTLALLGINSYSWKLAFKDYMTIRNTFLN